MGFFPDLLEITAINLRHHDDIMTVQIAVKKIQRFTCSFFEIYCV